MTSDTKPHHIYVLIDPRDNERRYVGQTTKTLEKRLSDHLRTKEKNHRGCLMRSFVRDGVTPIIELIETIPAGEDWANREMFWIELYRKWGCDLTNTTDGGEGTTGWIPSTETRKKIGIGNTGKKRLPEFCENARQAHLGKPKSPEHIENIRQARMKPIAQYMMDGITLIRVWDSAKEASEALGIRASSIGKCANEHPKYSHAGKFVWKFYQN